MSNDTSPNAAENGGIDTDADRVSELEKRVELLEERLVSEKQDRKTLERKVERLDALAQALRRRVKSGNESSGWFDE